MHAPSLFLVLACCLHVSFAVKAISAEPSPGPAFGDPAVACAPGKWAALDQEKVKNHAESLSSAFALAEEIHAIVEGDDLAALLALLDKEWNKPRLSEEIVARNSILNAFGKVWVDRILHSAPPCISYYGNRPLGEGAIWIENSSEARVHRLSAQPGQADFRSPPAWVVGDRILPSSCFIFEWLSSDNFEELSKMFSIPLDDLRERPGFQLGATLPSLDPIDMPGWGETIGLTAFADTCEETGLPPAIRRFEEGEAYVEESYKGNLMRYEVLAEIDPARCNTFVPNLNLPCERAAIVAMDSGGASTYVDYGAFGQFTDTRGRTFLASLRYFSSKQKALDFAHSAQP